MRTVPLMPPRRAPSLSHQSISTPDGKYSPGATILVVVALTVATIVVSSSMI
jgi:hypothetical protein